MSTVTQSLPQSASPNSKATVDTQSLAAPPFDMAEAVRSAPGTPTWEVARFYPYQGDWTEVQYFALDQSLAIEFNDGVLEFLPMPTKQHHRIMQILYRLLDEFVTQRKLGEVFVMGYPVRTLPKKLREPDVFFVAAAREASDSFASGCDLAVEVVSAGGENRERDLSHKRAEYAAAGIPEYWIVDQETKTVTVLTLPDGGKEYAVHGEFKPGETATSVLLDGFAVDVTACFAAAEMAE